MPEYQILLLPKEDYWAWIDAAKDYALRFGVPTTADPDAAGRFMAPQQIVTIAGAPAGYPAQGDIRAWFRRHYPTVRLDYVPSSTPAAFGVALAGRLSAAKRLGDVAADDFKLRWPADSGTITQGFGEHPELYRRWGLPGHEGLDIQAPQNAKIYACADGTVLRVDRYGGDPAAMRYGNSLRLEHAGGYVTVYAHLAQVLVKVGEVVRAGQVIGLAGATGNSSGAHLHLSLKRAGASAAGQTTYPRDFLDPTPFLDWPDVTPTPLQPAVQYPWRPGYCLVGLHGRADGPMQDADFGPISQARIEAVKLMSTARPEDADRLKALNPRLFLMLRLFASFDGRVVSAADFATWLAPDMLPFYQRGVRYFEIHNEPNLRPEGWTTSWNDGTEFGNWFLDVRSRLRQQFPAALFGYPGLSPGGPIDGLRMDSLTFLTGSDAACRAADWIGVHCYWTSEQDLNNAIGGLGYLEYRRRFPDKLLFLTEFSNASATVDKRTKGQQYVRYYKHLRSIPGIGAAFSFVVSATSPNFQSETWRGENGVASEIPGLVGARSDTITAPPPPPPH
jgi:murein DD-endopeptidase MepM/ murein hydrolase activator NlpD